MLTPQKLPTEFDFDPFGGCLDAQVAWKNFGGVALDDAFVLFCENAGQYSEDFMWMGHVAFAYYFPILDRYLRTEDEEDQAWFIACVIIFQFDCENTTKIEQLKPKILDLANFVIQNIERFGTQISDRKRIYEEWIKLKYHLEA